MKLPRYQPESTQATRYLFFTGKGGLGNTSLSCATALKLAEAGRRVWLVSTDLASNLDEVLETRITNAPTPIPGVPRLLALNINPVAAAAYRERVIGPMRGLLPETALHSIEEQLSGSYTMEISAFDEFSGLMGDVESTREYDHIVFDTAPTGHTLLLLDASAAYNRELQRQTGSAQPEAVRHLLEHLRDPTLTPILLVTLPEATPFHEAAALPEDLRRAHLEPFAWVINQSLLHSGSIDPLLRRREEPERRYLREVVKRYSTRTAWLPWQTEEPTGPEALVILATTPWPSTASAVIR